MNPAQAALSYRHCTVMTAGKIPSMLLLLERLQQELTRLNPRQWDPDGPSLLKCQNIVAQLQMALDFERGPSAAELFDVYDLLYESISRGTPGSMRVSHYLTNSLIELYRILPQL